MQLVVKVLIRATKVGMVAEAIRIRMDGCTTASLHFQYSRQVNANANADSVIKSAEDP